MKQIFCDVCKREVLDPIPDRTFFHLGRFDYCEPCRDDLEAAVKYTVRAKKPFDMAWFDELRLGIMEKAAQRGKVEVSRSR
jgi:hypothetical protein